MAEIKSTLDLVLERTRNLTLTEEEKRDLQRKELEGKMRSLARKYLDGLTHLGAVKAELDRIAAGRQPEARQMMKNFILEEIDPEADNNDALLLLRDVLGFKEDLFNSAIGDFQKKIVSEKPVVIERLKEELAAREVSGSAVAPNPSRSKEWELFRKEALEEFRGRLRLNPDN